MREEIVRAVGALKKCFNHVFHFWKQQYFNKNRSGIVVIVMYFIKITHVLMN